MKVYVRCDGCGRKAHLDEIRRSRVEYPWTVEVTCSHCGTTGEYRRGELQAEKDGNATAAGAVVGGLAGALAGPVGVAIGAGVGGILGQNRDREDEERAREFDRKELA